MSPDPAVLPRPPPATRRWLGALLALAVTVPVSLSPLLGNFDIPGFRALLSLYPAQLRETALPLSAMAMGLVAISVQFFSTEAFSARKLRRAFVVLVAGLFALLGALAYVHNQNVVQMTVGGRDGTTQSYVVAAERTATCSCPAGEGDAACIQSIGLDPALLPSCWDERALRSNSFVLLLLYLVFMSGLGALVGLLVMTRTAKRRPSGRRR
jgi:hypothetical protein